MDDPWGSPWATDSPAKIDLPTAPQNAHFAPDHLSPWRPSPARSPWNDGEAWGGWNDAGGGKESPGWGRSPGLKPLKGSPLMRKPSPDPWTGLGLGGLETTGLERDVSRTRRDSERSRDDRIVDSAISLGEGDRFQRDESLKFEIPALEPPLDLPEPSEETTIASVTSDQLERPKSPDGRAEHVLDVDRGVDKDEQPSPVHELVEIYDGTAQRSDSPDAVPITGANQPMLVEERLEEEVTDLPGPELDNVARIDQDEGAHEDGGSPVEDSESTLQQEPQEQEGHEANLECDKPEKPTTHAPKPPPIPFPIDLTQLDHLFPSTKPVNTQPEPVPDIIIDDTFASVGERKAWYRISRFGSLRKHNSGGDENYVRVGWAGSEVRERTIKTVRRWMEEDSITGRVVLGRRLGASGASMFNWDSSAPPVEIGELLGRNGNHSRQTSLNVRSPVVSPTAVSFGWTSSLPSSPTVAKHPLATELQQTKQPISGTPRHSESLERSPIKPRAPIPSPIQPPSHIIHAKEDEEDDDDDEWGEMVSSPTVANSGVASLAAIAASLDVAGIAVPSSRHSQDGATNKAFDGTLEATTSTPPMSPSIPPEPSEPATAPQIIPVNSTATTTARAITEPAVTMSESTASDEDTVAEILGNLPDLSYMLR